MDKYTITGADGSADVVASADAYAKALSEWKANNELPTEKIEAAVEAVFDRFPGERIAMPALLNLSVHELGGTPDQHKALTARVHAYVSGQCGVKEARNTGRIDIALGKAGGTLRLSKPGEEVPARPAKKNA